MYLYFVIKEIKLSCVPIQEKKYHETGIEITKDAKFKTCKVATQFYGPFHFHYQAQVFVID